MDLPFFLIITFTNATINNVNPIVIRHRFLYYPGGSLTTFVSNSWMAIIDGLYPPQKGEAVGGEANFPSNSLVPTASRPTCHIILVVSKPRGRSRTLPLGINSSIKGVINIKIRSFVAHSLTAFPKRTRAKQSEEKRIFPPILLFRLLRALHVTSFLWCPNPGEVT